MARFADGVIVGLVFVRWLFDSLDAVGVVVVCELVEDLVVGVRCW